MMKIRFGSVLSIGMMICIVTGDEMRVHSTKPETKAQSKWWKRASSPPPKKFKLSPSAGKVMLVAFWDSHGIILAHSCHKVQL